MTKPRKTTTASGQTVEEHRVWKRPIPLQLLHVGNTSEVSTLASSTTRALLTSSTTGYLHGPSNAAHISLVTLALHHLGQKGGVYTFPCTPDEKQKWVAAIDEAKASLKKRLGEDVYNIMTLDDSSFRYTASSNSSVKQGRVNCTAPFSMYTHTMKYVQLLIVFYYSYDTSRRKDGCRNRYWYLFQEYG
jgi:hypothetical protein